MDSLGDCFFALFEKKDLYLADYYYICIVF